jgi:PrtD family type I secretion system ABC transporter
LRLTRNPEIDDALRHCRQHFLLAAAFSGFVSILYLAPSIYMLQVYDRVLSGGSKVTLAMLTVILALAYVCLVTLDSTRTKILARAGVRLDRMLGSRAVAASLAPVQNGAARSQALRDLDVFRQFISGQGVQALFDLPWIPVFIVAIFFLHQLMGLFALLIAMVMLCLLVVNEWVVKEASKEGGKAAIASYNYVEMILRNADVVRALGMMPGLLRRWQTGRTHMIESQLQATDKGGGLGALIKFVRMLSQSLILGLGAYLVLERQLSAGAIFAGVLLFGRAMQPVEQLVGGWRGIVAARESLQRLKATLEASPPEQKLLELPKPRGHLSAEGATFLIPGTNRPALRGITFQLEAGLSLGVVGPSGSGKSTLCRALLGLLRPVGGAVRLDGYDVAIWPRPQLGPHVGYLPQDIELFADTVAANIARFGEIDDEEVIEAARIAGVHALIQQLPNGYDTHIGEGGMVLPGGYRQRIALARAVYGRPALVVLDEPSSNLDSDGDAALANCLQILRGRGTTVVVISHRPATLNSVDRMMILRGGTVEAYGPREEIMQSILKRPSPAPALMATGGGGR